MTDANFTPEFDPADVDSDYGTTGGDITVPTFHDLKPFKFWCQKALPLVYDDSLSYYEVLCKVVNYLNNLMTDLTTGTGAITQFAQQFVINQQFLNNMASKLGQNTDELESYINDRMEDFTTAYNELQDYVNAYFNNLDVQNEIDTKLDAMAASGQFNVLFDPVIQAWMEEETEYINTSISTQNSTIATQNSRISVLEGRMDTFASLPSGSTSGNAELLDIRTNFLGETFGSAGDAVRASDYISSGFSSQPIIDEVFSSGTANYAFFDTTKYKGGKYAIILNNFNNSLLTGSGLVVNNLPSFLQGDAITLYADSDETSGHAHVSDYLNEYVETITETYSDGYRLLVTFSIPQDATYTYVGLKYYISLTGSITPHRIGYATNWINAPVDPTLSIEGDAADAKATGEAITQLNERIDDVKSEIKTLGENALTDDIAANTANEFTYEIIENQYYNITVTLSNPTGTFTLRTKSDLASATFEETLYSGTPVNNLKIKATKNAHYLYLTSPYSGTLDISVVSPKEVYNELSDVISENATFVKETTFMDEELFSDTEYGGYITTSSGIGTIISTSVTANANMSHGVFTVKAGDTFDIIGRGGNAGRLWAFTDTDYREKSLSASNVVVEEAITITAPVDGYLIVNFNVANPPTPSLVKKYGADKVDVAFENAVPMTGIDMFATIGCLGDSYTHGGLRSSDQSAWLRALKPYPEILAKKHGITVENFGYSGSTVKTYIANKLPEVLNASAKNLYILSWGINDGYTGLTLGTIDDINDADYTQNADTFYGNYGKIIAMLQNAFPLARFVIFGPWLFTGIYAKYNEAAKIIANHFGIGYCNPADDPFFNDPIWEGTLVGAHPTQITYTGMAYAVERLLSITMWEKQEYYRYAGLEAL